MAQEYVPGEVIVKMKASAGESGTHKFIVKIGANQNMDQAINDLLLDPNVEFAEPNYIFRKQSAGIEGDPMTLSEVQEELQAMNTGYSNEFGQTSADINADEAWASLSNSSERPIVAIIDSGVDYNHSVFVDSNAIWVNQDEIPDNGIDDDGNGYIDDIRGWNFVGNNNDPMDDDNHGTHVAGIVLGMTQNIFASPLEQAIIQLMPLKFLDQSGVGTTSDALEAINYAINNGASVLNNSWGGGAYSEALHDAITTSYNNRLAFIAAAGNSANNNDSSPIYPASYDIPHVVSIAATSSSDSLASFSNFGASSVHVASPGVSILSTLPNDSFGYSSGTSMAAPFAAGLAALMIRENGDINGYQVKGVLFDYSQDLSNLSGYVASQSRIDAFEAVSFVQSNNLDDYQPDYAGSEGRSPASTAAAGGGGCGMIYRAMQNSKGSGDGSGSGGGKAPLFLALLFAPFIVTQILRMRRQKALENRREFPRYKMESEVKISVGDRELVGNMSSISMGGAQINTDALLEKGGIVTLNIATPEGDQQFEVKGQVVWSEEKKAYGVKFCDTQEEAMAMVGGWTKHLSKT